MTTLNVPGTYQTIQDAVDHSAPGDTIFVDASYTEEGWVNVSVNNLTFDAPAEATGITLLTTSFADDPMVITLAGDAPIAVQSYGGATITGNSGANVIVVNPSSSAGLSNVSNLSGGGGNDTFMLWGGAGATGFVDGGDGFDTVQSNDLGNYSFTNVETLATVGGSVYATIAQLSAFSTITAYTSLPEFHLRGAGGTLDFTGHLDYWRGVAIYDAGVTSGYTITGSDNNDLLNGSGFGDTLRGGFGDDELRGNGGDDILEGGLGDDILDGGDGNDTASYASATSGVTVSLATNSAQNTGGAGTDTLVSIENLIGSDYADTLTGNASANSLYGGGGNDTLAGGMGDDILEGGQGDDILDGGDGNDTASYASATSGVTVSLATNSAQDTLGAGIDTLVSIENLIGSDYDDTLTGNASVNSLAGGRGNDTFVLSGGAGATGFVDGGDGFDTVLSNDLGNYSFTNVETLAIYDSVYATIAQLSAFDFISGSNFLGQTEVHLRGAGGTLDFTDHPQPGPGVAIYDEGVTSGYTITGSDSHDLLNGSGFGDTLRGGSGNDELHGNGGDDILDGGEGFNVLDGGDGNDTASYASVFWGMGVTVSLANNSAQNTSIMSTDTLVSIENLIGSDYADTLTGNASANSLFGGGGNDTLDGGLDNDILDGGDGNDTASYASATSGVRVSLAINSAQDTGGAGIDTLVSIENLIGSDYDDTLTGNASANSLYGGGGNDILDGGLGVNFLDGGDGTDTASYASALSGVTVSLAIDSAQNTGGAGIDTLVSIENLIGSDYADTLIGNNGNNVLDGGGGADTMRGYGGDDTYFVDNSGDLVFEAADGGNDTVFASISYVLAAGQAVETLAFTNASGTDNLNLTGNEIVQTLLGNNGANTLDGGGGADTMWGYGGDDRYFVDNAGDLVFEGAGGGTDKVFARTSYALRSGQSVEILRASNVASTVAMDLTGNNLAQSLYGNAGNNVLDGGGGGDTMWGFGGDDTYVINTSGDRISEVVGEGTDTVNSRVSYVLAAGQSVETLRFTTVNGTADLDLTGNEFNQTLIGNNGANHLDGGGGVDMMYGYGGDDAYFVDNASDMVFETSGQGTDTVYARASYVLAAGQSVETLRASSVSSTVAMNLTGNSLAQTLYGNAGANVLDGGGGGDTLKGYAGDDTYVINSSSDLVFESSGQGSDTINSRVSYVLAAGQSVETLKFTSASGTGNLNLTGNEVAQTLTGNNGNNILDGGGGGDTMRGYAGDDTYVINSASDLVFESNGQGSDTVNSRVSYTLAAGQSVETLKFTSVSGTGNYNLVGNEVAQTLLGNNGDNLLDGKGGADILRGYGGADTFRFSTTLGSGNVDHIVDFSAADDTIRLDQTIFAALGLGTLNPAAYKDITGGVAVDSSDRILYDHSTGALYYDADGSGTTPRIQFAILDNKPAVLTNADFFVVS